MRNTGDKIFDLLKNEDFVLWVVKPREESKHYWSKWLASNPERKRDVELARQFILSSQKREIEKMPEEGYDYVLEKIVSHSRARKLKKRHIRLWKPLSVAASIGLLIFASLSIFNFPYSNDRDGVVEITRIQKEAPMGSKITTRLPDGSMVTLNAGSTITFPESFGEDTREVVLNGEAFFEVEHNPSKPFIVQFRHQKVKVLGTSFNIRSYDSEDLTQVSVATGKVSYSITEDHQVILKQDEMAIHLKGTTRLERGVVNKLEAFGWRDRILYFDSYSFEEIKVEVERWFGVTIKTSRDFEPKGTYSGKFENASLNEVLTGLSFIYRFEYTIEGSEVNITNQLNHLPMKKQKK